MKKYLFIVLIVLTGSAFSQNTWTQIADYGGGQRERAVAFSISGKGYVTTGQDTTAAVKKDMWQYDPATNSWTQKADFPGSARRDAIAFSIGSKGYVGTGINAAISWLGVKQKDFYEYNPITNTWAAKANYPGNFNQGIYYACAFATATRGYVCGGKRGASYYSNETWEYNPATNTWASKAAFAGGDRYGLTAFCIDDKGYVGLGTDENIYENDLWMYNPASNNWTAKADFPASPRFNAIGFALNGRGYFGLGSDGGYMSDLYEYNPDTDTWDQKSTFAGSARRCAVVFTIAGKAYAGTGKGFTGKKRSMYKYSPAIYLTSGGGEEKMAQISISQQPIITNAEIKITPENTCTDARLQIYAINGQILRDMHDASGTFEFNRDGLASGIYLYSVSYETKEGNTEQLTGKILIQ